jgi:cytochrome b561
MSDVKYNLGARTLHWVLAILVIVNLALGLLHDPLEHVVQLIPLHKSLGLTVLIVTLIRIGWRLASKRPAWPDSISVFERVIAKATHALLYVLMLAMPLTGWIFSSAGKYPLAWFGIPWPKLPVTKDGPFAGPAHEAHELLGWLMLALVVLHIAAALRHHFLLKDGMLRRML